MKRLLLVLLVLAGFAAFPVPASADDLSCGRARDVAGHPNAYCSNLSSQHVRLWFPWRSCAENVYQWHEQDWFWTVHRWRIYHCAGWH